MSTRTNNGPLSGPFSRRAGDAIEVSPAVMHLAQTQVRALLESSPSFYELPPERRARPPLARAERNSYGSPTDGALAGLQLARARAAASVAADCASLLAVLAPPPRQGVAAGRLPSSGDAIMSQEVNFKAPASTASQSEPLSDELLVKAALDYHRFPTPGKITVLPTKTMTTQRDLALAYSPGVAAACLAIRDAPIEAANLTTRGNLVAVGRGDEHDRRAGVVVIELVAHAGLIRQHEVVDLGSDERRGAAGTAQDRCNRGGQAGCDVRLLRATHCIPPGRARP